MATASFVSELIRVANEVDRLTLFERRRLLERAANVIRDCRGNIGWTDQKAEYPPSEIETQLRIAAREISAVGADVVASLMLCAARTMNDLRVIADALRNGCSVADDSLGGKYRALVAQRLSQIKDGSTRPSLPEK